MSSSGRFPTEYGDGAIRRTGRVVADLGAQRVLLVCGRRSFEASGASSMLPRLEESCAVRRWSDFSPNTDIDDLGGGLAELHDFQPDLVLGVGGGSAMDMAKLLCAFATAPAGALRDAVASGASITARTHRLVLAPTTSGSGSQSTHFAVVYVGLEKFSIAGPAMYPDHVVLDPQLAVSGSAHQRATSGIDAVCQAIESLWAVGANDWSRRRARHALRLLLAHIERFVNEPTAISARAMSIGSHLAGQAIDVSKTTAAHALSYGITKRYGVDHGSAVALTLGAFIEAHRVAGPADLRSEIAPSRHRANMDVIDGLLAPATEPGPPRFAQLLRRIGLPASLGEVGVSEDDQLRELVDTVNTERLGNNPVRYDAHGLLRILRASL